MRRYSKPDLGLMEKTHLQHLIIVTVINLVRVLAWPEGKPLASTRTTRFTASIHNFSSIPRPAVNLVLYHGVLAPHARWRRQAVSYGRPAPDSNPPDLKASPRGRPPRAWTWAALMRRVFDLAAPQFHSRRCPDRRRRTPLPAP